MARVSLTLRDQLSTPFNLCRALDRLPFAGFISNLTSFSRYENTLSPLLGRPRLHSLHPAHCRTRRSARHTPPLHFRHTERAHHPHGQRIHPRQHLHRKWDSRPLTSHFSPATHRPHISTPAPIGTRARPLAKNTVFCSALRPFSISRSDKILAVGRIWSGCGARHRESRLEEIGNSQLFHNTYRVSPPFPPQNGRASAAVSALTRAIARFSTCIVLAKSLSLPQDCQ